MKLSYQQLVDLTGKNIKTLRKRLEASTLVCDDLGPGKPKLWESSNALQVIYGSEMQSLKDPDGLDLNAERARLAKEQADKVELDNAERRKKLLPAESVQTAWVTMITNAKTKLTGLPSKLAALSSDSEEGRRIFNESKTIVDESLMELAQGNGE